MSGKRNIKIFILRTLRSVRNFLLSPKCKEFLIFLFFLFIASFFWLLQKLNDSYEAELAIPLRLENVPANVVMTLPPPENIQVVVKDKGTVLLNYMLARTFYPITINFKELENEKGMNRIESSSYQKLIASQLMVTSQITSVKPGAFDIIYTYGEAKKVPVTLQKNITTEKLYYLSEARIKPDSVLIYAPKNLLDTIKSVYTQKISYTNLSDTIRKQVALQEIKGVKLVPDVVDITLCTDMYTEKKVEVPIHAINFPADKTLKTFPSKVSVIFRIGVSKFNQITADDFLITVSYDELLKCTDKYHVKLKSAPKEAAYIRIESKDIDFIIEQVSNIE